jgi:two-component system, cell cycle sensor histidine kinase and response regulator CckA
MPDTTTENQLRIANTELSERIALLYEKLREEEKAVQALQDSEKRYRRLFESAKDGILILDADTGKVVDVNPFLLRLLGYSYDELYGKHIWELGVFKDIAASKDAFKALQDNEYIRYDDLPLETRDAKPIAVEFVSNVYLVDHSKVIQCNIRDITERKRVAQALRILAIRNEAILSAVPDIIMEVDQTKRYTWANQAGLHFFGKDVVGRDASYYFEGEQEVYRMVKPLFDGVEDTIYLESSQRRQDGEKRLLSWWCRVLRDEQGRVTGALSTARDITDQKHAEEELQEITQRLHLATVSARAGVWDWKLETNEMIWDDRMLELYGLTRENFPGGVEAWERGLYPEDSSRAIEECHAALRGEIDFDTEFRVQHPDKKVVHIKANGIVLRDETGKPLRMIGLNVDITDRKQVEESLQDSEERHRRIVESLSDAFLLRVDGVIVYANPAAIKLFRANELGDLIGKRYLDLVHPNDRALSTERIRMSIKENSISAPREHRVLTLDGQAVDVESTEGLIKFGGETQNFGVYREITNRKRVEKEKNKLQDQLLQSQKMESVGRLAGGVAHDFNNMLGVIVGHVEIAMEQVDPAQPLYENLQEIRKAAERSSDLTRQLLAFARKQTVSPKIIDMDTIVEGMLKMLRRLIGEDIHLAWLPGVKLWPVKIDPSQIDQILANLSINARDAIAGVGKITIETRNVAFDEIYCADHAGFNPGEYVLLAFSDDGCGMCKETLPHLFEPFFTTKEVGKGTGLGLATVYGIVKQNNGFINVYSEPDQGTTLKIYLPRHIGKVEKARMDGPQEPTMPGHETVLVVEDEPALLELSRFMLEKQGYRVLAAATPSEAIHMAEEHTEEIHLIMTDVVMPEMNGRELARKMLSLYPSMKRLFMSGYTADVIAHHGVLDEGVHFLQKPFSRIDLSAKVREALDQK